jgi:hypothetical protein
MDFNLQMDNGVTFDSLDLTDRDTMLASLPKNWGLGVEIGVWQGWYTSKMLCYTSMNIVGIDPWEATESYEDVSYTTENFNPFEEGPDGLLWQEARYVSTMNRLAKIAPRDRWSIMRSYSSRAAFFFVDETVDFVYIDGEHTYEAVKEDMKVWWSKVKTGGIMAGHDYNETNPGTKKAVNEFAEKNKLNFKITGTTVENGDADAPSWIFIKE